MNKKSIEDRFTIDMDAYLNGVDKQGKLPSEEYKELLEIGKVLADNDFSRKSNKEEVFDKTLKSISRYKGEDNVRKSKKLITKVASIGLVGILGFSIMQTSFAQEVVDKVLKTISLGHITVTQEEFSREESYPVPDKLKGKIFDKDGNPIEEFSPKIEKIYTANGEQIADADPETGEIITSSEAEKMKEEQTLIVKDSSKLNDYTCFNVILPSYLPEGYKFDRAEFYKDENGIVENSKYINLYFTNEESGEEMYMEQRFADEETGYSLVTDGKIEEVKINGVDGVIVESRRIGIDWEYDGVMYGLSSSKSISKNELIKIAESIK